MKKNYITGILGGILGGLIASIPWILMYVYGNMILSLLAIIIAIGVLKGYQLCKGKVDHKLPVFIVVISILSITIATLFIIPLCLIAKEGVQVDLNTLKRLYDNQEFVSALTRDYVVSLLFTFMGISGVVASVKKQIQEGKERIDATIQSEQTNLVESPLQENLFKIKEVFLKYNAIDKKSAIEKEIIVKDFTKEDEKAFKQLRMQQIILKHKGKYYFSLQNEKSLGRRFLLLYGKIMLWIVIVVVLLFLLFAFL